jgi:hypothetical protein
VFATPPPVCACVTAVVSLPQAYSEHLGAVAIVERAWRDGWWESLASGQHTFLQQCCKLAMTSLCQLTKWVNATTGIDDSTKGRVGVQVLCPKVHGALHHLLADLFFFGSAGAGDTSESPCACGASRACGVVTRLPWCFLLPGSTRSRRVQASRHQGRVEGVGAADHCREGGGSHEKPHLQPAQTHHSDAGNDADAPGLNRAADPRRVACTRRR